jgi:hypothetical protein
MNKQPQPGEWWKTREGKRVYIAAVMPDWFIGPYPLRVFSGTAETDSEKYTRDGGYHFDGLQSGRDLVEHLPDCTGWDWQPVKYPRYWETRDRAYYAFLRQDSETEFVLVEYGGEDYENTEEVTLADRAELTEAEAMSRIVPPKPIESPDDWVTQDRVPVRMHHDECRWSSWGSGAPWISNIHSTTGWMHGRKHVLDSGEVAVLSVRCRRKDLPPVESPKPPTLATRTITFCEYIVWDDPGCERLVWALESDDMLYRYHYPTGQTRAVEIPE